MDLQLDDLLDLALNTAYEAGRITLEHFQQASLVVEYKDDRSPVTIADRRAEHHIVERIRQRFPDHSILGEEHGEVAGDAAVRWIIDPIDGTKSFAAGVPLYGVMIGVEVEGTVAVGVVNFPALGDMHYASIGGGSYWNGRRAGVSTVAELQDARVLTTDARKLARDDPKSAAWSRIQQEALFTRTWGDCYGHILVATGRAEVMLDPGMSVWDCAALKPIVEEAGGVFTDWRGVATIHGGDAISTNGALHDRLMELVRRSE